MAILGSVACATHRERRSYYLAERALLRSPESLSAASKTSPLRLDAHRVQSGSRQARAECEIRRADGTLLFGLDVTYKLVPEKIFQRLFAAFRVDMRRTIRTAGVASEPVEYLRKNPYRQRLQLTVAELDRQRIRCDVPSVPVEACAGHFPLYPAVPVAVLMEAFSNAGGALLRTHRGAPLSRSQRRHPCVPAGVRRAIDRARRSRGHGLTRALAPGSWSGCCSKPGSGSTTAGWR